MHNRVKSDVFLREVLVQNKSRDSGNFDPYFMSTICGPESSYKRMQKWNIVRDELLVYFNLLSSQELQHDTKVLVSESMRVC